MFFNEDVNVNTNTENNVDVQLDEALMEALELQEAQLISEIEASTLNEATIKRRKETIKKQRVTVTALGIAKAAGDPMYAKMMEKHRQVKDMRKALLHKYSGKAKAMVKH